MPVLMWGGGGGGGGRGGGLLWFSHGKVMLTP